MEEKTFTHQRKVILYKHISMCFPRQCGISWIARPPFGSLQSTPPYKHMRPRVWDPHFWLGHDSDTIYNDLTPPVQILSALVPRTPHGFVFLQSTQQWGKRPLHIKEKSLFISTSPYASLGDVGFHGLQDPFLGHYTCILELSTLILIYNIIKIILILDLSII